MTEKKKTGFEALAKASMHPQEQLLEVRKRRHAFFIGLPREISLQENRISLTPDAVALLVNNGHDVWVEAKAGIGSKFTDKNSATRVLRLFIPHRKSIRQTSS